MVRSALLWFTGVLGVCSAAMVHGGDILIAEDGVSRAVVVVGESATLPEKHAAAELANLLKQVTGAEFDVVSKADETRSRLLVGQDAVRLVDPSFTTAGLGAEGSVIRVVGGDLILAGGRPRGTLYAVYAFLEDVVGCRWWSSKISTIPRKPTLTVADLNIRFVPRLEYRESFWFDAFDGDWAVRNKCNGHSDRLSGLSGVFSRRPCNRQAAHPRLLSVETPPSRRPLADTNGRRPGARRKTATPVRPLAHRGAVSWMDCRPGTSAGERSPGPPAPAATTKPARGSRRLPSRSRHTANR